MRETLSPLTHKTASSHADIEGMIYDLLDEMAVVCQEGKHADIATRNSANIQCDQDIVEKRGVLDSKKSLITGSIGIAARILFRKEVSTVFDLAKEYYSNQRQSVLTERDHRLQGTQTFIRTIDQQFSGNNQQRDRLHDLSQRMSDLFGQMARQIVSAS